MIPTSFTAVRWLVLVGLLSALLPTALAPSSRPLRVQMRQPRMRSDRPSFYIVLHWDCTVALPPKPLDGAYV
eukprot:scaffold30562_cov107-Isochrysis_galbana.AAC.2